MHVFDLSFNGCNKIKTLEKNKMNFNKLYLKLFYYYFTIFKYVVYLNLINIILNFKYVIII
jgi:hypothetical protein